jgi:Leucine-rich repeat (LRR) protein
MDFGVKELFLRQNQLTDIENLKNFKNSIKVELTSNTNLKLTKDSFKGWRSLEYLVIDNIDLKGSEPLPNILRGASGSRLREIIMSNNELKALKIADFPRLIELVSLKINDNQLENFDYDQLRVKFPKFHQIAVAGNQWNSKFLKNMLDEFKPKNIKLLDVPIAAVISSDTDDTTSTEDGVDIHVIELACLSVVIVFIALTLYIVKVYGDIFKIRNRSNSS